MSELVDGVKNSIKISESIKNSKSDILMKLTKNFESNINYGSRTCPIISECRNIAESTINNGGDLKTTALNAGLHAMPSKGADGWVFLPLLPEPPAHAHVGRDSWKRHWLPSYPLLAPAARTPSDLLGAPHRPLGLRSKHRAQ